MANFNWTKEADNFLIDNWIEKRVIDIAKQLGCSRDAVLRRARKLNIAKKTSAQIRPQYYEWSEKMDKYLNNHYQNKTNQELSVNLGMSKQAVMRRLKKLGLSRRTNIQLHYKWDNEMICKLISAYSSGEKLAQIAEKLEISLSAVKRKISALELEPRRKTSSKKN